jgi:hypothetical protein
VCGWAAPRSSAYVLAVAALLAGWIPAAAGADTGSFLHFEGQSRANEACFFRKLDQYVRTHPEHAGRIGRGASIFVAEQLARHVSLDPGTGRIEGPAMTAAPEEFCERYLWQPFLSAFSAAIAEERAENRDGLAPLGTVSIESRSVFVGQYQNLVGKHCRGHADITGVALDGLSFSSQALSLVQRASQTPDLFRWNDERYHAHTPEYDPLDPKDRKAKLRIGRERYEALLANLNIQFRRYADAQAEDRALLVLGLMSHMAQDLAYHRGMTLRQHAGLAYVVNRNPDLPPPPLSEQRFQEAVALTQRVVGGALRSVSSEKRARLLGWRQPPEFDFARLVRDLFGSEEDIGVAPLMHYWALSLPYKRGERSLEELADASCDQSQGVACWNIEEMLRPISAWNLWLSQDLP